MQSFTWRSGDYLLQRGQKPFELAVLFVPGLMNVIQYLDARRAVV
jgi:hypothetical protein